jgi:hypothetical protein
VSRLSRQCGILNISQPYRPPRPVTGIALLYFTLLRTADLQNCNPLPLRKSRVLQNVTLKVKILFETKHNGLKDKPLKCFPMYITQPSENGQLNLPTFESQQVQDISSFSTACRPATRAHAASNSMGTCLSSQLFLPKKRMSRDEELRFALRVSVIKVILFSIEG